MGRSANRNGSKEMRLPRGFTRRNDGRLEYRFNASGRRVSVYGGSVKECYTKADQARENAKQGVKIGAAKITFGEYVAEWLELRAHTVIEATIINYEMSLKRAAPYINNIRLSDLDRRDILRVQAELSKRYATSTTNTTIRHIRTICQSAVADRIIQFNPCESVKPIKRKEPKITKTTHRALTIDEQREFFRLAREKKSYYYNLFVFLIQTGCRCGEALALNWSDIDYKNNVIHIRKTITLSRGGWTVGELPKTEAGYRDIPMTRDIKINLTDQRDLMIFVHGIKAAKKSGRVFLQRMDPDRVQATGNIDIAIRHVVKGTSVKYFGAHAFRDTFATRAIEQGMQPNTLKEILGHSSITMTMDLYAQVLPNTKEDSMNSLVISV